MTAPALEQTAQPTPALSLPEESVPPSDHSRRTSEAALAQLHQDHGRAVFGFLLGLTYGDRQRAEDLVQETMIRAWRHPEALESDHESMRPWLYTVARRLAIDARRARYSRPKEVCDIALDASAIRMEDPIEPSIEALDVREALRGLSEEHRLVLVQVYFRGLSVKEAADALGIPVGTVKSRTYYALRCLKKSLKGYGASR
ncbi:sigma-70 family RNA polymerase sigma factor [Streptomyces sp. NPDC057271]|uniref:sigma-70 family RNA polymerase sigma factor n=1 Tax=unclassified Streptomyces TaxID=2593676 RepID=UPI00363AEAD5